MIGKIIGAYAGDKLAKKTGGIGGAGGAALGVVAATALRRMSLPAMFALGVGGFVAKKLFDKNEREKAVPGTRANSAKTGKAAEAA